MSREFTSELRAALRAQHVKLAAFASFHLRYALPRFWTGSGTVEAFGCKWTGLGHMAGISDIEETSELRATGVTFTLRGLPVYTDDGINLAQYVQFHAGSGGRVEAFMALFDLDAGTIIDEPRSLYVGRLETPQIIIDPAGQSFDVVIGAESVLVKLNRKPGQRLNEETQRALHPGDRGFEFVARSVHKPDDFG